MAKKKRQITVDAAIDECRKMFGITDGSLSKEEGGDFQIDRREYERGEVVSRLFAYFRDNTITCGYCAIEPPTPSGTAFCIKYNKA